MNTTDGASNFQIETSNTISLLKLTKALMAGDSHIIYSVLTIDGKEILSENNFDVRINQKTGSHDEFEISCPTEALEGYGAYPLSETRNFLGKSITIELKQFGQSALRYTGIISSLRHRKFDGFEGHIIISGHSPTILLENGLECQSYENKSLKEIIEATFQGYPQEAINADGIPSGIPSLNARLPYIVQYKETDFEFLNRLALRFGEWFYYNGQQLVFGPADGRLIELVEEQDLYEFELKMQLVPQKFSYTGYSEKHAAGYAVDSDSESVPDSINPFQRFAIEASENVYGKIPQNHVNQSLEGGDRDLRELVRRQKEKRQNVLFLEGRSNNPNLRLGDRAKITAYMPDNLKSMNGEVPIETYKVIEIHHHHDGLDGYYNTFVGIPYRNVPYMTDEEAMPLGEEQSAVVVDNNDPKGMGRIRVQFEWQKARNEKTPWIRIVQSHAGSGKGSYFIPELGEEVLVGFEGRNAEKAVVLGMHYNGKEVSGFHTAGNDQKVIQTRSGTKIVMNDAVGSVFIEDPSGNSVFLDGQGNIKVDAPNDITLNAGNNMDVNVGNNMTFNVGNQALLNIIQKMMVNTPFLQQIVSEYYHTQAGKALINSENEIKIESPEMYVSGQKKLFLHSDESAVMNSKGTAEMTAKGGNKLSNTPVQYKKVPIWMDSRCIVKFRPKDNWTGEFGYDWMRMGDTKLKGDATANIYKTISLDYNKLRGVYQQRVFKKKSGTKTITVTYFIPWLCLFPKNITKNKKQIATTFGNTSATLHLTITIENVEPLRIEMDYDKTLFKLDKDLLTPKTKGTHSIELTITCLKEFDTDKDIKAVSVFKNAKGEEEKALAGKIMVVKNKQRYQQKIVVVQVSTNLGNGPREAKPIGRKTTMQKFLRQALVEPTFETLTLNLSLNKNPSTKVVTNLRTNFNAVANATGGKIPNGATNAIQDFLNAELYKKYGTSYQKAYKVYFIDEEAGDGGGGFGLYGRAYGIPSTARSVAVYRAGLSDTTIAHETLHAMGLQHPFHGGTHMFKRSTTDNIMDYSDIEASPAIPVVQMWKWQWPIIYPNVEPEK